MIVVAFIKPPQREVIERILVIPARPIPLGWFVASGNYRVESLAVGPLAAQGSIKHGGLWEGASARPPPPVGDPAHRDREVVACRSPGGSHERTYVDQGTFEATL